MEEEKKVPQGTKRPATLAVALLLIALITGVVSLATLKYGVDVHVPIAMLAVVVALVDCCWLGMKYDDVMQAGLNSIMAALPSCMILMLVGILIGIWMRAGVIPGLIYYGLNILSPAYFPLATMVICSIIALCTGSSWSTEATIGVALMGIGNGLGVPAAMTAGCVVSGAYFGDKMSPLSDTTNLAPAVAGNDLFDHIRAMLWTTLPTLAICCVIYVMWGRSFAGQALDAQRISAIQTMIAAEFNVSWLCVVPPLVVILASALKVPAMPGICLGIVAAMLMAFPQGVSMGDIWALGQGGYKPQLTAQVAAADAAAAAKLLAEKGVTLAPELAKDVSAMISRLVGRGGMFPMMWSVELAIAAMAMGGFLEAGGFLRVLLAAITKGVRRAGGLIATTIASCFIGNLLTGSQYLSIIIPGRMFKQKFEESGLAPRMLSRSLEDSGTLTSVLIPWNVCAGYAAGVLGVKTLEYVPYAIFNWICPFVAILITYLGIGIFWRQADGSIKREARSKINVAE
ncbi:MAG: Na+/H+ antiporter NhaC [Pyramidobacter sp.]|nr:Na+/H+ antiporter NhaC [Pyramidobacter sp.]MBQ9423726.1 Na+/H+ antiporter NhaC [Pyramidobacter sp.]